MVVEYLMVVVLAVLAGGWSIPAGLLVGLDPLGVFIAAVVGSLAFAGVVLSLGGPARDRIIERFVPDAQDRIADGRAGRFLDRWGIPGLAMGSVVLGPMLSLAAALVLGVDRGRFAMWYALSTIVGFGLLTVFWALVL